MLKKIVLLTVIFLFPLFFLPATDNFFITNKLYLLAFAALVLLLITSYQLLITKKLVWSSRPLDWPVFFLILATALSTFVSSPNKIQAILNPNFGLVSVVSLAILYFYLSRHSINFYKFLLISSVFLSLVTIISFFRPFKFIPAGFNLMGSQLDLAVFLGFMVMYVIARSAATKQSNSIDGDRSLRSARDDKTKYLSLLVIVPALGLTLFSLYKQFPILPPLDISWYAAIETLKSPLTALFGVGPDNFGYLFTQAKTVSYNQTQFAQFDFFTLNRSGLLHILSVTGLVGFISFLALLVQLFKQKSSLVGFVYLFICLLIFPISLPLLFLFFFLLSVVSVDKSVESVSFDLRKTLPAYFLIVIASFAFIAYAGYFLGKSYLAEFYYNQAIAAYNQKKTEEFVKNLEQASVFNPSSEKFHFNLSQAYLNLFDSTLKKEKLNEQDQKILNQAAQMAINEAKTVTNLNPYNSANWAYMGLVYKTVAQVNKDAAQWTISSYRNAMELDPKNPVYYTALSTVFYSVQQYDEATRFAEQAMDLKSASIDPYYGAAWSSFQLGYVQKAVTLMEQVVNSLDKKKDEKIYNQAEKDLATFKEKLPIPTPTPTTKP